MSMSDIQAYSLGPEEGEAIWLLGGLYTFKALGEQVGDAYTLVEVRGPVAVPRHFHEREEEGFYVAEGEVTLLLGEERVSATAGSFGFAPRNVEHAFKLESPDARLLLVLTPAPAVQEALFREMGEPAQSHTIPPPPAEAPDPERLAAIAARHGTRIIGPPPA